MWRDQLSRKGIAVMAGLCFTGSIQNTQLGVQSVQGALFILVSENTFCPMYSVLATFPQEMPLFLREYRNGLYSTHIYYISKMIAMFPGLIVEPLVFVILTYWLAGLRYTLQAFLFTAFITIMTMNVSTACGCFFSSAFESVALAMACLVPFDYVLMITSGMFVNISQLNARWDSKIPLHCFLLACLNDPDIPCLVDGDDVLQKYSFKSSNFWLDILAIQPKSSLDLLGFFVGITSLSASQAWPPYAPSFDPWTHQLIHEDDS
uniref:ABC-2 type transporter transmembrane domain-containing protein n=1 Tax=Timema tahoe TaxID=61484 RepID=A0A7R9P0A0_9NEOP|nr:unnamed protein product [Timema tahoe]